MPMVRPLETLHNALSLRQLDAFLSFVTSANFKTPQNEYLPTTPSNKGPKALVSTTTIKHNEESNGQQQQSKHKRSIPPHTLGLNSSQDSSKYNVKQDLTSKYFCIFLFSVKRCNYIW